MAASEDPKSEDRSPLDLEVAPVDQPAKPEVSVSPPPNGGFQAWLQVVGVFFCWFNSWGLSNSFGVFQTYYETSLPQSPSQISWIGSLQALLLIGIGILAGPAYDAGYFTELIWAGTLLVPFGFMMVSLCGQYWEIMLAQAVVVGLGMGCLFVPSVSVLPQYFTSRRVLANGLAASGASFGGTIYPILFHRLLTHTSLGFGWSVRILGFMALGTSLVAAFVLRVRVQPPKRRLLFDFKAFRDPSFSLLTACLFFALVGVYAPTFFIELYALKSRDPPIAKGEIAAYVLPILNAGAIPGRIAPGFIEPKTGVLNLLFGLLAMAGVVVLCWTAVHDLGGLIAFALIYGFAFGGILSLPPPAVVSLCPDLSVVGTRFGTAAAIASLGVLIGTPISAAFLNGKKGDVTEPFLGLQVFAGVILLISGVFCLLSRGFKVGWKVKSKA